MARTSPEDTGHAADVRPDATDEELLSAFLGGDEAMFGEIVRRYEQPLHAFICRLTGQPAEAPDLFQETFVRVFQHAASFRGESRFKTWLYAVATNVCRSHGRKMSRRETVADNAATEQPSRAPGPNGAAQAKEVGQRIAVAVAALPHEQREVFVLKLYDEMSYSQIAGVLGRPLGTVKSQMRAALGKLRTALHDIAEAYGVT